MSSTPFSLTKVFKGFATGAALLIVTEVVIFTLIHSNPGWLPVMYAIAEPINQVFNATGITDAGFQLAEWMGQGAEVAAEEVGGQIVEDAVGGSSYMLPQPAA